MPIKLYYLMGENNLLFRKEFQTNSNMKLFFLIKWERNTIFLEASVTLSGPNNNAGRPNNRIYWLKRLKWFVRHFNDQIYWIQRKLFSLRAHTVLLAQLYMLDWGLGGKKDLRQSRTVASFQSTTAARAVSTSTLIVQLFLNRDALKAGRARRSRLLGFAKKIGETFRYT